MFLIRINGNAYVPDEWYEPPCIDPNDPKECMEPDEYEEWLDSLLWEEN